EGADPDHEHAAAPVAVAERAAEQDQRGQRQQVAVEDPLQRAGAGAEVLADLRQRDVDDGAVEERHPRAGDGNGEQPAPRAVGEAAAVASRAPRTPPSSSNGWARRGRRAALTTAASAPTVPALAQQGLEKRVSSPRRTYSARLPAGRARLCLQRPGCWR